METINLELTEEEAVEVLYLARAEAEKAHDLGDRLINGTGSKMAGFNQHDRAGMLEGIVEKLFPSVAWVAEDDPEMWEDQE